MHAQLHIVLLEVLGERSRSRYLTENPGVTLDEAQIVVTALAGLRGEEPRIALLASVAAAHARLLTDVEKAIRQELGARAA